MRSRADGRATVTVFRFKTPGATKRFDQRSVGELAVALDASGRRAKHPADMLEAHASGSPAGRTRVLGPLVRADVDTHRGASLVVDRPVGYRPGDELAHYFKEVEPVPGQLDKEWWANGFERARHEELTSWRQGGHSNSLKSLRDGYDGRYGAVTEECLGCHAGDYILAGRRKPGIGA